MINFFNQIGSETVLTDVDVWLVAGQSNADGRVPIANPPTWLPIDSIVPSTKMFNDISNKFEDWEYGVNGGGYNNADLRWSFDSTSIKSYASFNSRISYVIKNTLGGTSIGLLPEANILGAWNTDFPSITGTPLLQELEFKYNTAKLELKNLGFNAVVKGVLWHQGEGDRNSATNENDYYQNLKDVISYVRGFVGDVNLPFVYGSIATVSAQYSTIIETAHFQIATEDSNAYIVDMSAGSLLDAYHFDAASSEFLGDGIFNIIKNF